MPKWRNWQTQWTQNPPLLKACRFESGLRHQYFKQTGISRFFCFSTIFQQWKEIFYFSTLVIKMFEEEPKFSLFMFVSMCLKYCIKIHKINVSMCLFFIFYLKTKNKSSIFCHNMAIQSISGRTILLEFLYAQSRGRIVFPT